ncbi:MAG: hypothetical protein R2695_04195 [Acidimicrobiales bacterium]
MTLPPESSPPSTGSATGSGHRYDRLYTAAWTFFGVFSATALGWLQEVSNWLGAFGTPRRRRVPDPSVLGEAFVACGIAAAFSASAHSSSA